MDIKTLRGYEVPNERFVPKFSGNRETDDPFAIIHRPLIRGHQHEWFELLAQDEERREGSDGSARATLEVLRAAEESGNSYRSRFLRAHVVGSEGITDGDDLISLDALLDLLDEVTDLGSEVMTHVLFSGVLTEDDSKN